MGLNFLFSIILNFLVFVLIDLLLADFRTSFCCVNLSGTKVWSSLFVSASKVSWNMSTWRLCGVSIWILMGLFSSLASTRCNNCFKDLCAFWTRVRLVLWTISVIGSPSKLGNLSLIFCLVELIFFEFGSELGKMFLY